MPWQRKALVNGEQAESSSDTTAEKKNAETRPLIKRLVEIVTVEDSNVKLKKSALDFLAALCKDDEEISTEALSALGGVYCRIWRNMLVVNLFSLRYSESG
jgi:HSP90 family molecular chaperone